MIWTHHLNVFAALKTYKKSAIIAGLWNKICKFVT